MDYKTDDRGGVYRAISEEELHGDFRGGIAKEPPELESLLTRLFSTSEELARAEARLATFADRLGGPAPECAQSIHSGPTNGASGFASRMDALYSSLSATLTYINSTISRLERLA